MEKEITSKESLEIITDMISKAKRNIAKGGSFYFLLWGFVVTAANFGHYAIAKFTSYPHPYIVWSLSIPAIIITIWYSYRQERDARATGPFDRIYGQVWIAAFACMVVVIFSMTRLSYQINPLILLIAGMATYITGSLLKFKPLLIGGVCLWLSAIVAFQVSVVDQYLVGAIAIIIGYLIPGFILKRVESE